MGTRLHLRRSVLRTPDLKIPLLGALRVALLFPRWVLAFCFLFFKKGRAACGCTGSETSSVRAGPSGHWGPSVSCARPLSSRRPAAPRCCSGSSALSQSGAALPLPLPSQLWLTCRGHLFGDEPQLVPCDRVWARAGVGASGRGQGLPCGGWSGCACSKWPCAHPPTRHGQSVVLSIKSRKKDTSQLPPSHGCHSY